MSIINHNDYIHVYIWMFN